MSIETDKTIPGIKRLTQAEEDVRNSTYGYLVPGKYYVNGIRYPTSNSKDAQEILQQHQRLINEFKALNEMINARSKRIEFDKSSRREVSIYV